MGEETKTNNSDDPDFFASVAKNDRRLQELLEIMKKNRPSPGQIANQAYQRAAAQWNAATVQLRLSMRRF